MTDYLSCAETAKLLRLALKESFAGVKFSVRSSTYAGGASIDVRWTDGPNSHQVKAILDCFCGAYFDGMIDYKGSRYHSLDGKPIHLGADFVHGSREYSDAAVARALRIASKRFGATGTVEQYRNGTLWNTPVGGVDGWDHHWNLQQQVSTELAKYTDRLAVGKSPTLARLKMTGDDGYGQGTVGHNGKGGEAAYRAMGEARRMQS
jgi:hypothetical protein